MDNFWCYRWLPWIWFFFYARSDSLLWVYSRQEKDISPYGNKVFILSLFWYESVFARVQSSACKLAKLSAAGTSWQNALPLPTSRRVVFWCYIIHDHRELTSSDIFHYRGGLFVNRCHSSLSDQYFSVVQAPCWRKNGCSVCREMLLLVGTGVQARHPHLCKGVLSVQYVRFAWINVCLTSVFNKTRVQHFPVSGTKPAKHNFTSAIIIVTYRKGRLCFQERLSVILSTEREVGSASGRRGGIGFA